MLLQSWKKAAYFWELQELLQLYILPYKACYITHPSPPPPKKQKQQQQNLDTNKIKNWFDK